MGGGERAKSTMVRRALLRAQCSESSSIRRRKMESKERQNYYLRTVCFHSQLMLEGGIVKKNTEKDYFWQIPTIVYKT